MIRVLVADDHPPTRAGVRVALEGQGFEVCAEAATAGEAVAAAVREQPAICLLDIRMPGSGIAAAASISDLVPDAAVVMLTVSRDDDDLFDALRAGASGYLLKDIPRAELPDALRRVVAGDAALSPNLVARLIAEFRERGRRRRLVLARAPGARLSSREWEVLELLDKGLTTAQIAERLFIAEVTVRTHVSRILHALRVPNRESAVRLLRER